MFSYLSDFDVEINGDHIYVFILQTRKYLLCYTRRTHLSHLLTILFLNITPPHLSLSVSIENSSKRLEVFQRWIFPLIMMTGILYSLYFMVWRFLSVKIKLTHITTYYLPATTICHQHQLWTWASCRVGDELYNRLKLYQRIKASFVGDK